MESLEQIRRGYGVFLRFCGLIAGVLTFVVMCLVVANALLRFLVNAPIAGTLELTESALPLIIFLSLALTQWQGGHIKVVLLTQHLPAGGQRAFKALAMLLGALLFAWAAYAGFLMALKSWSYGELERGAIRFPIWPIKFAVFFGLSMLSLQFLIDALLVAAGGRLPDSEVEQTQ
ncbi:TRAP transporter small permease [Pseudooceanicola sediminis]|uniref:TRAP transporter small permease protein n=1 Tax=Pseudooceanicola sediminis TaxID=2211117 RepID=A0A399IYI0_9RHOB|nr:TRAP transporter small permease [Pseudooceanicola sediminis]KAA2314939.1 TRAP transporter small permease [Puniceibacterium sp. HSS470]RII37309.1 TRAP transporter small permease [Pseudooceanicola sediminis]|tara:strand:- start:16897 stop:17421 length:525 start_codon:yes stop_codon:yes gene_type:complete